MGGRGDALGKLMAQAGVLDNDAIADVLRLQRGPMPFASLCYLMGYADEETLVRQLSGQLGVPGVVLDKCVIRLRLLGGAVREFSLVNNILCLDEDEEHVYVAADNPLGMGSLFQELEFMKGKTVVPYVALHLPLCRTLRECLRALDRGEEMYAGLAADPTHGGQPVRVITPGEPATPPTAIDSAHDAVLSDVTSEVAFDDLILIDTLSGDVPFTQEGEGAPVTQTDLSPIGPESDEPPEVGPPGVVPSAVEVIDIDRFEVGAAQASPDAAPRHPYVLVADSDGASLAAGLADDGFSVAVAAGGAEAIGLLRASPPVALVADIMLPEVNGVQLCRSLKESASYRHIPFLLMSAVVDSGHVTDEMIELYGADAYVEKPVSIERVRRLLRQLVGAPFGAPPPADDGFERAIELYRAGELDEAVAELRHGIDRQPESAKHHFVLANLLQRRAQVFEAIDEYEATVALKPTYFPALTRLAYLYYRQGFSAKAIEMWGRSLRHCPDDELRRNIEVFMRKLIADMQSVEQGSQG